jgi:hypothetical protein
MNYRPQYNAEVLKAVSFVPLQLVFRRTAFPLVYQLMKLSYNFLIWSKQVTYQSLFHSFSFVDTKQKISWATLYFVYP